MLLLKFGFTDPLMFYRLLNAAASAAQFHGRCPKGQREPPLASQNQTPRISITGTAIVVPTTVVTMALPTAEFWAELSMGFLWLGLCGLYSILQHDP